MSYVILFMYFFRKVTVIDYQGTCSPQESHHSSAPRLLSIIKTVTTFGNFLWTLILSLNIQDLWQTTLAFAGDAMYSLNGKMTNITNLLAILNLANKKYCHHVN